MSNDVAAPQGENLPALVSTPALDIGPQDIALPRLYVGHHLNQAVKDRLVTAGSLFTGVGADDPDAREVSNGEDPVRVHVLAMRKGKSVSRPGEDLETYAYDDPDAPPDAYVTYNYVVALPQVDSDLPYKFLLKRTGTTAAKKINLVLAQTAGEGPAWEQAFDVKTDQRENTNGEYWVPIVSHVEAVKADVETSAALAAFVPPDAAVTGSGGTAGPAI